MHTGFRSCLGFLLLLLPLQVLGVQTTFVDRFNDNPSSPQPFLSPNWDVSIFTRDRSTWFAPHAGLMADHTADCGPPPAQHEVTQLEELAYRCRNHLMTAMNDRGFGHLTLTPNHMVDFRNGTATIEFDLSTFRRGGYDWLEFFVTPFGQNLVHPTLDIWEIAGPPRNGILVELTPGGINQFKLTVFNKGKPTVYTACGENCKGVNTWVAYDSPQLPLVPSQRRRDRFKIKINRNRISFGVFNYFDGVDNDNSFYFLKNVRIPRLKWGLGVVQFSHASFNPTANCGNVSTPVNPPDNPGQHVITCEGDTWHWDNVRISPAKAFTIIPSVKENPGDRFKQRYVDPVATPSSTIRFAKAAPKKSFLRFSAIGSDIEVSFDGGENWHPARQQPQTASRDFRFNNYFHRMPVGTREVMVRGGTWWGGLWHARDFSIWSRNVTATRRTTVR